MASPLVDIAILGGGIFGLCAAHACAKAGLSVQIHEKRRIGGGASGGLLGVMSPYSPDRWSPKKAFQLSSLLSASAFWEDIAEVSGMDPGYSRVGRAIPLMTEEAFARSQTRSEGAAQYWQGAARMWHEETCAPAAPAPFGFVCDSLSARIHPRAALAALASALRKTGVRITENSAPCLVDLRQSAAHVIIAAGHEASALHQSLAPLDRGVKGEAARLAATLPADMPVLCGPGFYLVSHPGAGVAIGSTKERDWTDPASTSPALDALIHQARSLVPALKDAAIAERWAGVRPRGRFPDPVVGPVPGEAGLWVMTGGYGIGFGVAHSLGAALAQWITDTPPTLPERFTAEVQLA